LKEFEDIFTTTYDNLPRNPYYNHRINTGNATPIRQKPYRTPHHLLEFEKQHIEELLKNGVIRPSESPWASPTVIVPKKGGKWRLVVDYRLLNKETVKDAYPLPRIDELLDSLQGARIFSSLDMFAGFHEIPVEEEDIPKTAFLAIGRLYEYLRMPFGLCNAPATFQRMVNTVYAELIGQCLIVYMDDCNIYSATFKQHLKDLRKVFELTRKNHLRLNAAKCFFGKEKLEFLGFIVSKEGTHADPRLTDKVQNFPAPTNAKQALSFLMLASYYRRFIQDFAKIAEPIRKLMKKNVPFKWDTAAQEAFRTLKTKLVQAPILARPDFNKEFILYTDASGAGLGAVLSQEGEDGQEHVIAYASKATNDQQRNYEATKLELLAVVWAVTLFNHYLAVKHFTLVTDHTALGWLKKKKDLSGIYARWVLILQGYDYTVRYKKGKTHTNADVLSRLPR
jgi:hypothetical protein